MDRLSSIVVGIDFSPASAAALAQGLRIARWNRAALQAVHVVDTLVAVELQEVLTPMIMQVQDALVEDARTAWASFAPALDKTGVEFEVIVDNEVLGLVERCRFRDADLLILGQSAGQRAGIAAAQLVRRAPCRVLLARENHPGPFKNILVGVDFSEASRTALRAAIRIVAQDGGSLTIAHAVNTPWTRFHYRAPTLATSPEFQTQFLAGLRNRLEDFCRQTDPETDWARPRYEILENASHGAALADFARRTSTDLVVVGTRGRSNLREFLIGSTAERLVRESPCSLLAVKPE